MNFYRLIVSINLLTFSLFAIMLGSANADDNSGNDPQIDRQDYNYSFKVKFGIGSGMSWQNRTTSEATLSEGEGTNNGGDNVITEYVRDGLPAQRKLRLEYDNRYVFMDGEANLNDFYRGRLLLTPSNFALGYEVKVLNGEVVGNGQLGLSDWGKEFKGNFVLTLGNDVTHFAHDKLAAAGLAGRGEWLLDDVNIILEAEGKILFDLEKDTLDMDRTESKEYKFNAALGVELPIKIWKFDTGLYAIAFYGMYNSPTAVYDSSSETITSTERIQHEIGGRGGLVIYFGAGANDR